MGWGSGINPAASSQLGGGKRALRPWGWRQIPKVMGFRVLVSSTHRGIFPACREKGWNGKRMEMRGVQPDRDESREYFLAGIPRRSRTRHWQPPGWGGMFFIGLRDVREYSLESLRTRDAHPMGTPNPSASQAGCPHPTQTLLGDAPRGIKEDFSSLEEVGGDGGDGGGPPQPLFPTEKKMKEKLKKKSTAKTLTFPTSNAR